MRRTLSEWWAKEMPDVTHRPKPIQPEGTGESLFPCRFANRMGFQRGCAPLAESRGRASGQVRAAARRYREIMA